MFEQYEKVIDEMGDENIKLSNSLDKNKVSVK